MFSLHDLYKTRSLTNVKLLLSLLLFLPPASVMAAAVCSRPGQRHAGLPHGSYCLPHGLPSDPLRRGGNCELGACTNQNYFWRMQVCVRNV